MLVKLGGLNSWIAARLHTSHERIVQFELGGLFALGFTLMQIGEWAASVACWVTLTCILFAKMMAWEGIGGQKGITAFLRFFGVAGVIAGCVLMVSVTALHKPEDEPWSNLKKLWERKPHFSVRITSLVTNGALVMWGLDDNALHSGYFCRVPMLAEVYLTNNQTHWTIVTNLHVEAMDARGQWRDLGVIDTLGVHPFYRGLDLHHVQPWEPIDGKYFDQQVAGKNIGPGETASGWLFMNQNLTQDITGPLRFSVSDLQGGPYEIGPVNAGALGLLEGGFRTGHGFADLSSLKQEDCPRFGWK